MAIQTDYDIKYDAFGRPYYVPKEAVTAAPAQSILTCKGRKGAEEIKMIGKALILDTTQPVVWYKTADENGNGTLDGYDLSPHEEPPEDNGEGRYNELDERLKKIENLLEVIANGGESDRAEDDGK